MEASRRSISLLAAGLALLLACGSCDSADEPQHERVLDEFFRASNALDMTALLGLFADDAVFTNPAGERFVGHDGIRTLYERVWGGLKSAEVARTWTVNDTDRIVASWTFRGTTKGGEEISVEGINVFTMRAGRIASSSLFVRPLR